MPPAAPISGRRWPPLAAALVALVLVLFALPNPFRVPQENPTAAAEYAPVPGKQDEAQDANFGDTDLATSGGIGSGGLGEGLLPGVAPPPPPQQLRPRQKHCVGRPPRQTEDPLSPPCVPFWDGNNGGRTYRGVTKDEVTVVFYNDLFVDQDLNRPYRPSDESGSQDFYEQKYLVRTLKAQLRYFQGRFQTYGRNVHMYGYKSTAGPATQPRQREGEAHGTMIDHPNTFATAALVENAQDYYKELAQEYKVPSFGWNEDVPAAKYQESAGFVWSFGPDQETESEYSASFICRKLYLDGEGKAKFTDDPQVKGKPRKFGLIWPADSQRGPFHRQLAALLQKEVDEQCGMKFAYAQPFSGDSGAGEARPTMERMSNQGITTVVCYCVPVLTEQTVRHMQNAATGLDYYPEWYWDHASAMDRPVWQQTYGSEQHFSFGVSYLWRQPEFEQSYAYQAYKEQEPNSAPNARFNFEIYHIFLNLFTAIQAAGPELTPQNVKRGMFTFRYQNPDDPYLPTGSYGPGGPSPYTFIDTAMGWWFDPNGTPPGGVEEEGCNRVLYEGARFYGGSKIRTFDRGVRSRLWPEGDDDIYSYDWPCSEDTRKLEDPGSSTGT